MRTAGRQKELLQVLRDAGDDIESMAQLPKQAHDLFFHGLVFKRALDVTHGVVDVRAEGAAREGFEGFGSWHGLLVRRAMGER